MTTLADALWSISTSQLRVNKHNAVNSISLSFLRQRGQSPPITWYVSPSERLFDGSQTGAAPDKPDSSDGLLGMLIVWLKSVRPGLKKALRQARAQSKAPGSPAQGS